MVKDGIPHGCLQNKHEGLPQCKFPSSLNQSGDQRWRRPWYFKSDTGRKKSDTCGDDCHDTTDQRYQGKRNQQIQIQYKRKSENQRFIDKEDPIGNDIFPSCFIFLLFDITSIRNVNDSVDPIPPNVNM